MFLDYTNNYPWLWAVYVLVLAVIVGIVGTCCLRMRRVSISGRVDKYSLIRYRSDNLQHVWGVLE